ncbi:MFS transporter [Auraticoccus cholistanensis]|uniref:MFS transporter n=1 Tax=Auraticoccus cholistanensis TaxID=2656650 RepID=UPI0018D2194B
MKRSLSLGPRTLALVVAATSLVAATYGLVRLGYGLFVPDVGRDLQLQASTAGAVTAGGSLAYCAAAAVAFLRARRFPRWTTAAAAGTAALGAAGMAVAASPALFAAAAVVGSAGAGLASPALVRVVARNLPAPAVSRHQSVVNSGTGPGLVAASLVALSLLPEWRTAWGVIAVVTALAGAAVLLLDRPGTDEASGETSDTGPGSGFAPRAWLVPGAAALLLGAATAPVWTYGRTQLLEAGGASPTASVTAWTALGLGSAATVLTAGALDRWTPAHAWALTAGTTAAATAALGWWPDSPVVAHLVCGLFGWGYTAATAALIAWASRIDPPQAAAGTAALFVALVAGQSAGSAAAGALSSAPGLPTTLLLGALTSLVAAAVAFLPARAAAGSPAAGRVAELDDRSA